jgi:hypothetical protein
MANLINADPTNGLKLISDSSSEIQLQANGITKATLNSSGLSSPGHVLQVVQATFTGTQTISASGFMNWTDITSLSVTITPLASSSKFLLMAQVNLGCITVDRIAALRFTGGNAGNFVGDAASSRARVGSFNVTPTGNSYGILVPTMMNYLDSPATTSAITYKVQAAPNYSSGNVAINYNPGSDADTAYIPRAASSLIVMEVAG